MNTNTTTCFMALNRHGYTEEAKQLERDYDAMQTLIVDCKATLGDARKALTVVTVPDGSIAAPPGVPIAAGSVGFYRDEDKRWRLSTAQPAPVDSGPADPLPEVTVGMEAIMRGDTTPADDAAVKLRALIYKYTGVMGTRDSDHCDSTRECADTILAAIRRGEMPGIWGDAYRLTLKLATMCDEIERLTRERDEARALARSRLCIGIDLEKERDQLKTDVKRLIAERDEYYNKVRQISEERDHLVAEMKVALSNLGCECTKNKNLTTELALEKGWHAICKEKLNTALTESADRSLLVDNLRSESSQNFNEKRDAQRERDRIAAELADLKRYRASSDKELSDARDAAAAFQKERDEARAEIEEAQADNLRIDGELEAARAELAALRAQLAEAVGLLRNVRAECPGHQGVVWMRTDAFLARVGETK
jgi:uncharacterized coiled-coil DUF342 family protein